MSATATLPHPASAPVDLGALKARQQATWAIGDYAVVGTTLQIVGERVCEAVDLHAGERVLDVAAGNGNATLAAARRSRRGDLHRLCRCAARARPGACRRRAPGRGVPGGRRRGPALRRPQLRCRALDLWRHVHAGPGKAASELTARGPARAAASGSPTGRRRASSARSSRRSAGTSRRRPACARPRSGARRRASPSCSPATGFRRRSRSSTSAIGQPITCWTSSGPTATDEPRCRGARRRGTGARWRRTIQALIARMNRGGADTLIVPSEYLEAVVTRR